VRAIVERCRRRHSARLRVRTLAGELTARLAYVDFDGARALAASENVALDRDLPADFADRWCDQIIAGKQRIASWLSDMTRTDADST
jgi:hypothetical protein